MNSDNMKILSGNENFVWPCLCIWYDQDLLIGTKYMAIKNFISEIAKICPVLKKESQLILVLELQEQFRLYII